MRRFGSRRRGQGMTEYVVIVGLIAVALIIAVMKFKISLQTAIEGSGDAMEKVDNQIDAGANAVGAGGGSGSGGPGGGSGTPTDPDDGQ